MLADRAAGAETLGTWARDALLQAARRPSLPAVVLAEVVALRAIVVNLQFAQIAGTAVTAAQVQQLIAQVDRDRFARAAERAAEAVVPEER